MKRNKIGIKSITSIGVLASLMIVMNYAMQPLIFGPIQFRIADALVLLIVFNPYLTVSFIITSIVVNISGPLGVVDAISGAVLSLVIGLILYFGFKFLKSVFTRIFLLVILALLTGVWVGILLMYLLGVPFLLSCGYIFVSQLTIELIGYFLITQLQKNKNFIQSIAYKSVY